MGDNMKPPLGIIPKSIWLDKVKRERFVEVAEMMKRYLSYSIEHVIPNEILNEYIELKTYHKDQESTLDEMVKENQEMGLYEENKED
jgi:hypothetical protein